jgi:hypothetical protein
MDKEEIKKIISWGDKLKQGFIYKLQFLEAANMRDLLILAKQAAKAKPKQRGRNP